ncbi:MAG: hypothetical protein OEV44_10690, partial [Spirochaetota bacterium]|nr:hypothetical protein [Spirochaetota bacterium]
MKVTTNSKLRKEVLLNYILEGKEKEITTEELLSIILSYNTNLKLYDKKAKKLLITFNNLYGLDKADINDFVNIS